MNSSSALSLWVERRGLGRSHLRAKIARNVLHVVVVNDALLAVLPHNLDGVIPSRANYPINAVTEPNSGAGGKSLGCFCVHHHLLDRVERERGLGERAVLDKPLASGNAQPHAIDDASVETNCAVGVALKFGVDQIQKFVRLRVVAETVLDLAFCGSGQARVIGHYILQSSHKGERGLGGDCARIDLRVLSNRKPTAFGQAGSVNAFPIVKGFPFKPEGPVEPVSILGTAGAATVLGFGEYMSHAIFVATDPPVTKKTVGAVAKKGCATEAQIEIVTNLVATGLLPPPDLHYILQSSHKGER